MTDQGFDLVPFPGDVAKVNKAAALVLAIKFVYERLAPGAWKETLIKKSAP